MIMITGRFAIDPARRTAFLSFVDQMIESERRAPGCLTFAVFEDVTTPNHFLMLEQWVDEELLEEHASSPAYTEADEALHTFIQGEPSWDEYAF